MPTIPPSTPNSSGRACLPLASNLPELIETLQAAQCRPVVDLGDALLELDAVDGSTLERIRSAEPQLLSIRSHELVEEFVITEDDYHRALGRVAGVGEVDAAHFELDRHAFDVLSLREARWHGVLPLGPAQDHFVVASWKPTSHDLHQQICALTGHSVLMVWGQRDAIESRLE